MNQELENPFGSIEDAHEFMTLMAQTVFETKLEIEADVQRESSSNFPRRAEALKLTLYTLSRLEFHMERSGGFSMIFAPCGAFCLRSVPPVCGRLRRRRLKCSP